MANYIELKINTANNRQREILVALLSAAGANGFEEERNGLLAFFSAGEYDEESIKNIIEGQGLTYGVSVVEEKNWNAIWESDFQPVIVDDFCAIRAGFHEPSTQVKYEIIITPKMSFGTGHHATTWMMVKAMEGIDFLGKIVFDFGTGTGILAILAEKCGAQRVVAVDIEEWSIRNATENFSVNESRKILIVNDNGFSYSDIYDIVLANINRNIILEKLGEIKQHLANNGVVLLSGLLTGDESVIVEEARKHALRLNGRLERNGWICLLMVNS